LTNPWRLDRLQQTTLIVAVAAIALFTGRTIERNRAEVAVASAQPSPSAAAPLPSLRDAPVDRVVVPSKWVVDTPLNGARVWHASVASGRHLYVAGGFNRPAGPGSDVRYRTTEWTTVEADGTLGLWKSGPAMTRIRIGAFAVVVGHQIYVLGGETGEMGQPCDRPESCFTASIERAAIRGDGSLGPWELVGRMGSERWGFAAVVVGTNLYVIGGNDGKKATASVERLTFDPSGNVARSQPMAALKVPRWAVGAVQSGDFLYAFGGHDGENALRTIERARVQNDGSLGDWELVGSMLDRRHGAAAVVDEDRVYIGGGYAGVGPGDTLSNEYLNTVESAAISKDGVLARFSRVSPMRSGRGYHGIVTIDHQLYAIGGGNGDAFVPTVERLNLR
jgi:hypothetical protein